MLFLFVIPCSLFLGHVGAITIEKNTSSTCDLPPLPLHGTYSNLYDSEHKIVPGESVDIGTVLNYSCTDKDYQLSSRNVFSLCEENKKWSTPPACYKTCTLYSSYTLEYSCFSSEVVSIPCQTKMASNSSVHFACKAGHVLSGTQELGVMRCHQGGNWDIPLPDCKPECGLEKSDSLTENTSEEKRDAVPWNVAIFSQQNGPFELVCGGTIINSRVVVSAAHCFYDAVNNTLQPKDLFRVAANKLHRQWGHPDDSAEQTSEIKEIRLHDKYRGAEQRHASDLALVIIETPFTFTETLAAICLDLANTEFDNHQLSAKNKGKVAGWGGLDKEGKPPDEFRILSLPFIEESSCRKELDKYIFSDHLTYDKFCAGYTDGTSVCNGDSGAGLVFAEKSFTMRWYLRGVVSVAPMRTNISDGSNICVENTYTAFTRVFALKDWLLSELKNVSMQREVYAEPPQPSQPNNMSSSGCPLPRLPCHGHYSISKSTGTTVLVPGEKVPARTMLSYSCDEDYVASETFSVCGKDDKWNSLPVCSKQCAMPTSYTVDMDCNDAKGKRIDCTAMLLNLATIVSKCKDGHVTTENLKVMTCRGGVWDRATPRCSPDCGLEMKSNPPTAGNQTVAEIGSFPWHIGVYQINNAQIPTLKCSGTLITSNIVLSSAFCFYDFRGNTLIPTRYFRLAAGQLYRDWNSTEYKTFNYILKSKAAEIMIHDSFNSSFLSGHLAIVRLATPFKLSNSIRPACYNLQSERFDTIQTRVGSRGKVSGWGLTNTGGFSDLPTTQSFPIVGQGKCLKELKKRSSHGLFDTRDMICAGTTNGSSPCFHDTGAGLMIPYVDFTWQKRWFLRGVVNHRPIGIDVGCLFHTHTIFASIFSAKDWLRDQLFRMS